jgi:hypothetical protein
VFVAALGMTARKTKAKKKQIPQRNDRKRRHSLQSGELLVDRGKPLVAGVGFHGLDGGDGSVVGGAGGWLVAGGGFGVAQDEFGFDGSGVEGFGEDGFFEGGGIVVRVEEELGVVDVG